MTGMPDRRPPGVREFESDPLPHLLDWLRQPAPDGVYPVGTGPDLLVVADWALTRDLLADPEERFTARSAVFGAVPSWVSGSAHTRALTSPLARYLDMLWRRVTDEEIRAAAANATGPDHRWPTAGVLLYWRLFARLLVPDLPERVLRRAERAILLAERIGDRAGGRRLLRLRRRLVSSTAMAGLADLSADRRAEPDAPDDLGRLLRDFFDSDDDVAVATFALFGAVCRASSSVLSWILLLDAGWRLGTGAGVTLRGTRASAPAADRVREALRLWPATWLIEREVRRETWLGAHRLKPGDLAYVCPILLHRDPATWTEPAEYRPRRWAAPPERYREAYLPFGTGPGACVGARFVTAMPARILAVLDEGDPLAVTVHGAAPRFDAICAPPAFSLGSQPRSDTTRADRSGHPNVRGQLRAL
ncbi:cytochrome P450 [Plantactinospora siamensis]|uniref:Cytochrome P450 n=1 Tax=Plantactinospora siamensis TaxID=555372 RepID=A0ABV6P2X8_9ACTN